MRICPACGNKRESEWNIASYHMCEACYKEIVAKHGTISPAAVREIGEEYGRVGLSHAGPLGG